MAVHTLRHKQKKKRRSSKLHKLPNDKQHTIFTRNICLFMVKHKKLMGIWMCANDIVDNSDCWQVYAMKHALRRLTSAQKNAAYNNGKKLKEIWLNGMQLGKKKLFRKRP